MTVKTQLDGLGGPGKCNLPDYFLKQESEPFRARRIHFVDWNYKKKARRIRRRLRVFDELLRRLPKRVRHSTFCHL